MGRKSTIESVTDGISKIHEAVNRLRWLQETQAEKLLTYIPTTDERQQMRALEIGVAAEIKKWADKLVYYYKVKS